MKSVSGFIILVCLAGVDGLDPASLRAQDSCDALHELVVGTASAAAGDTVEVDVLGGASCEVTGYILAIGFDDRVRFLDASPGEFLVEHAGADLSFQVNGQNEAGYVVVGAIFDISFPVTVPPTTIEKGTVLARLRFEIVPGASGVVPLLNRTRTYGSSVLVSNVYSRRPGEAPLEPILVDGAITIEPAAAETQFIRGDVNIDGRHDIADAVTVLRHIFLGDPPILGCQLGADVDGNGKLEVTDPIVLIGFLFLGTRPPAPPFPDCGSAPAGATFSCESYPPCAAPAGG